MKVGDIVTRLLAGRIPTKLKITEIDEEFIYCGPEGIGWKFNKETLMEVDEDMGWDGIKLSGSYLKV